ncbi:MAG: DUF4381 domain-containing protein [Bacteroidales bacterium]|nr:DUF4381 domain-containing protein [Bacteroidales bacterium]
MNILKYILFILPAVLHAQVDTTSIVPNLGALIEPEAIPFTFNTIGWKVLFTVVSIVIIVLFIIWLKTYIKNKFRREAIRNINNITSKNNPVKEIFVNLKIVAIKSFGRQNVANLSGEEWLIFLNSKAKNIDFLLFEHEINQAIYKDKNIDNDKLKQLIAISIKWINTYDTRNT